MPATEPTLDDSALCYGQDAHNPFTAHARDACPVERRRRRNALGTDGPGLDDPPA
jgi:hypothetical protein